MFNLPLAALWTAVLGEWNRDIPENTEIHVPIDHIIIHERFHNYQNDIGKHLTNHLKTNWLHLNSNDEAISSSGIFSSLFTDWNDTL